MLPVTMNDSDESVTLQEKRHRPSFFHKGSDRNIGGNNRRKASTFHMATSSSSLRPILNQSSTLPNITTANRSNLPPNSPKRVSHNDFHTHAHLSPDGRIHISFNQLQDGPLSSLISSTLQKQFNTNLASNIVKTAQPRLETAPPKMNIVIMVIGSRGDIQPFIKIAKELVGGWGHRVRVATHPEFKDFIEKEFKSLEKAMAQEEERAKSEGREWRGKGGIGEFFSVGGNPQELMAFMVKNPGLLPSFETIKSGDVGRRREQMFEMFGGFWRSCVEPSPQHDGVTDPEAKPIPFIADAIIANPPSFAHVHIAEKLGVPLHLMFTFPYSPTQFIPHPLANVSDSNASPGYTNLISYSLVEMMTWQGLGDLVNRFRKKTLGLEPLSASWAPGLTSRLKVPVTYMWSPSLIPKPADWGPHIDISGFIFLEGASSFQPPDDLVKFLEEEPENPPVYIGFGSIVVDDPNGLTELIFNAVKETKIRALVAKGWGGLGGETLQKKKPEGVYMLDNTPHDWLFPKVRAVVHHGGAGTTAIGLKCGKPTFIVSFFGDQPFWGAMLDHAGAGGTCPFKDLTLEKFVEGISLILKEEVRSKAEELMHEIAKEGEGAQNAVMSFYRGLEGVGVGKFGGERGRKERKRKEKRPFLEPEEIKSQEGIGLENTTAEAAKKEPRGEGRNPNHFRIEQEKNDAGPVEPTANVAQINLSGQDVVVHDTPSFPNAADSQITQRLTISTVRCCILTYLPSHFRIRNTDIKLSSLACFILVKEGKFTWKDLRLVRHTEWNDFDGPAEPLSGGAGAIVSGLGGVVKGLAGVPYTWYKGVKRLDEEGEELLAEGERKAKQIIERKKKTQENSSVSPSPIREQDTAQSSETEEKDSIPVDIAKGHKKSFKKIIKAGARIPMDFSLSLTLGFHNAPRALLHDQIRRPNRITGFHSSLRAAGKELSLGFYDSITGFYTKPKQGYENEGPKGALKGFGKASVSPLFRITAGVIGLFAFPMKGIHREFRKNRDRTVIHYIRSQRILQAELAWKKVSEEQKQALRDEVLKGWLLQEDIAFKKKERDDQLKRDISGVREIGWGQAKLNQLRKRERRRLKKWKKKGSWPWEEEEEEGKKLGGGAVDLARVTPHPLALRKKEKEERDLRRAREVKKVLGIGRGSKHDGANSK